MFRRSSASAKEGSSTRFIGLFYIFSFLLAGRTQAFVTQRSQIDFIILTALFFCTLFVKINVFAKRVYLPYTEHPLLDF